MPRLYPDNINEYDDAFFSIFLSYFPDSRRAEFRKSYNGEVISGKVNVNMCNADAIHDHRGQSVMLNVRV